MKVSVPPPRAVRGDRTRPACLSVVWVEFSHPWRHSLLNPFAITTNHWSTDAGYIRTSSTSVHGGIRVGGLALCLVRCAHDYGSQVRAAGRDGDTPHRA